MFVDKHMENTSVSHREGQCVSKDAHNRCDIIPTGTLPGGGLNFTGIVWLECSWKKAHKSNSLIRINVIFIYKLTKVKFTSGVVGIVYMILSTIYLLGCPNRL